MILVAMTSYGQLGIEESLDIKCDNPSQKGRRWSQPIHL